MEAKQTRQAALKYLTIREYSAQELQKKLVDKGHDPDICQQQIAQLKQEGLQSDTRYAESYRNTRINRGFGPVRIAMELQQKGIASDIIDICLQEIDWLVTLERVKQKKFGMEMPDDWQSQQKQQAFLQYRGFHPEQIRAYYSD